MTDQQKRTLVITAEVWTQHFINALRQSPNDLVRAERSWMAGNWLSFIQGSVFPLVADDGLKLSKLMVELDLVKHTMHAAAHGPRKATAPLPQPGCQGCNAAELIATLAAAIHAAMEGGRL